jgi:hypothetical protein
MKKVILLALLMPFPAFAQIVENFESGNITGWVQSAEGHWNADSSSSLAGKFSLHQTFDNPDAGTDRIGIKVQNLHPSLGNTRWSFLVRYGYDPSSLNNWSVFLMSDNGPDIISPDTGTKGYAIGVNLSGSDDTLRLWKVNGNMVSTVINCMINWQTDIGINNTVRIIVERSTEGNWNVSVSRVAGELIRTTSGKDDELFSQGWFVVYYRYSSTRDRLLWLDDISVEGLFFEDHDAPRITDYEVSERNSVELTLNEDLSDGNVVPENFSLNTEGIKSISVTAEGNKKYRIEFADKFINKTINNLIISKLCDLSDNCSTDIKLEFTPVWAEIADVVITEIMARPMPEVSLPGEEYIEITNRTEYSFNLKNWRLLTEGQYALFPEVNLPPSGIAIICMSRDTLIFKKYGFTIGIKQFPALTDGGRIIYVTDSTGVLIHGVEYSSGWYRDDLKSQGGWSLEMIDTSFPFYGRDNWIASESRKGGTPASANSVSGINPDISFYGIQNVFPGDSVSINMRFSEPDFCLAGKNQNILIANNGISSVIPTDPLFRNFLIKLRDPLVRGEIYHLEIPDRLSDFAGNQMQASEFDFALTEPAGKGDIMFNELLFNPLPGDPDYLELYNCSEKVVDASRLKIVSVNDLSGEKSEPVFVSGEERCFLPGEYYAITTDTKKISDRYFSTKAEHLFETGSLPSMPDDKGHLIMYNRELEKIDEVSYDDDMHFSLLSDHEGVSLEKTNPGNNSEVADNWHSATESSGWGTPGAPNSAFIESPSASDQVILSSSKITPDNDGYEDFLSIMVKLKGNGNVVSMTVFDETGNYVRKLAANLFAGAEASVVWDGTADDGSLVKTGIYIILITLYNDTGKTDMWKKVCTVVRN